MPARSKAKKPILTARAVLASSAFFGALPAATLDRLAAAMRPAVLDHGDVILADDSRRRLWIVLSGSLRVELGGPGSTTTIGVIGPGGYYNVAALLDQRGRTEAHAVGETRLAVIDGAVLRRLIDQDPALREQVGAIVVAKINAVFALFRDAIEAPLPERIARRLMSMAMAAGAILPEAELHLSQSMLAQMLGASRTKVSAELAELEKAGILRLGYRKIYILDAVRLRELAGPDVIAS